MSNASVHKDAELQGSEPTQLSPEEHAQLHGKGYDFLGVHFPAYRSPMVQVIVVGFILFLNPGMYNALAGLGGAGQVNATAQNNAGVALHTTFAVVGFVVGVANNYIGTKWTMAIGGIGYAVYSAAFLCYNHTKNTGFVIFSGALLGFCAAFLWCAQGVVMMSYPTESQRGKAIAITWLIFNLGSVIGAAVTLGQNWNVKAGAVTDGTYVAFIVLEVLGAILCCFLVPTEKVVRKDGTRVEKVIHPGLKSDMIGLYTTLVTDWWVVLLFPMFFVSNWFYTYQFNDVNSYYFNTRTRAFNNIFYWLAQIFGSGMFGWFLDWTRLRRRTRSLVGWGITFVLVNAIWGGGLAFLLKTNRNKKSPEMDIFDHDYFWYLFLYMWYGFLDAIWQTYAYYTMGSMSNSPKKLAYYAGFYKSIQAAGAAIISRIDALKYPFANEFASCWALMAGALLLALPVYLCRIKDSEVTDEDYASVEGVGTLPAHAHEKQVTPMATGPMGVIGMATEAGEEGDAVVVAPAEKHK